MDPLTHSALGAAVAGLTAGKKSDLRAPACGALAGALPDIDIIPTLFLGPMSQLDIHRGFTHSIVFAALTAPLLGLVIYRLDPKKGISHSFPTWVFIVLLGILSHIFLDCFTSYGTRIFLPFNNCRVAWGTIAVVDPLFSIPVLFSALSLFLFRQNENIRKRLFAAGLALGLVYLAATVLNKDHVETVFRDSLADQKIRFVRLMTTPMPFTNFLWVGIAEGDEFFYTGYYSNLDGNDDIRFEKDRKNHEYISDLSGYTGIRKLISFAKDFYTIDKREGKLIFNDLRYGSLAAGSGGEKQYLFSYTITNDRGKLKIFRTGRLRLTTDMLLRLFRRIAGEK
ncbi:MAG TPA: metal-dependent hydrolase [Spirochaetota bacterium]|nr:metal-dependent hydrolase [Spirochaetota bacterium]HPC41855.1 metal-dependent hydrolase [Spirochaetota bacterium]HPL19162.1 metal-dependent hydrolase [Spirochaetota bacterium]HQF07576.1 metal-dependent hydrolase [Spirochaetota bacterium]HQH96307.1 metal-dependent hydrolase [Spirochaetota bacterium]